MHENIIRTVFLAGLLPAALFFSGCGKESAAIKTEVAPEHILPVSASRGFGDYGDLPAPTLEELQAAKAATAKYNDYQQAVRDGYIDINVIVPEMGYHFLLVDRLDSRFEYDKPEILVYNREENGRMKLVAVEYAVPIALSPIAPAGFTGTQDVWGVYQNTLWTLHAWIWEYNPSGVFHATNPRVHLH